MQSQGESAALIGAIVKIGDLAKATRTQIETIRFYEREALLPETARTAGNYRIYDGSHVERLAFIRHCRSLDMTLADIRLLLRFRDGGDEDCAAVNLLLDEHIGQVAQRIRDLRALENQLRNLRCLCQQAHTAKDCGIIEELVQAAKGTTPARRANARGASLSGRGP